MRFECIRKLYNDKQMFKQPNGGYLDGWALIARRPCTVNGTLPQGRNPLSSAQYKRRYIGKQTCVALKNVTHTQTQNLGTNRAA